MCFGCSRGPSLLRRVFWVPTPYVLDEKERKKYSNTHSYLEAWLFSSKVVFNCLEVSLCLLQVDMNTDWGDYADSRNHILNFPQMFICSYVLTCTPVRGFDQWIKLSNSHICLHWHLVLYHKIYILGWLFVTSYHLLWGQGICHPFWWLFLNQRKENDHRNYFMINLHKRMERDNVFFSSP